MLTPKLMTEIIENHSQFCVRKYLQQICFKSILINQEITYDTVM